MAAKERYKKSVIILENDPDLADSIRVFLEDSYKVYIVQDPAHLMRYISNYKINVLVTDLDTTHSDIQRHLNEVKVLIQILNPGDVYVYRR